MVPLAESLVTVIAGLPGVPGARDNGDQGEYAMRAAQGPALAAVRFAAKTQLTRPRSQE